MTINPIKRLREESNLTQLDFAYHYEMTRISLIRYEQGCFPLPSEKFGLSASEVEEYLEFQKETRSNNYGVLDPNFSDFVPEEHPLKTWRFNSAGEPTLTKVCVSLCLHIPTMHRFELGYSLVPPQGFFDALAQAGYSNKILTSFMLSYSEFREMQRVLTVSGEKSVCAN